MNVPIDSELYVVISLDGMYELDVNLVGSGRGGRKVVEVMSEC